MANTFHILIVDELLTAERLKQALQKVQAWGQLTPTISVVHQLDEARMRVNEADIIFIDPLYFSISNSSKFIREAQSVRQKIFALFLKVPEWQNVQQGNLSGMEISPDQWRSLPFLDKSMLDNVNFLLLTELTVNKIIQLYTQMYNRQPEYQYPLNYSPIDPSMSGSFYINQLNPNVPATLTIGAWTQDQLYTFINMIVRSERSTNSHLIGADITQTLRVQIEAVNKELQTQTQLLNEYKIQFPLMQSQIRDLHNGWNASTDRIRSSETRLSQYDLDITSLKRKAAVLLYWLIGISAIALVALIIALITIITHTH